MADVNFLDYGNNALRLTDTAGDGLEFLSMNGYELGVLIGIFIIIVILFGLLAFMIKYGKELIPKL